MNSFFYACLLLCTILQMVTPLRSLILEEKGNNGATTGILLASTPKIIQTIGKSLSLNCDVPNPLHNPTLWSKLISENGEIDFNISNGKELYVQDNRFNLVENPTTSRITLQIKNLQRSDIGFYQCKILNPNGLEFFNKVEVGIRE